jgi:hypothetical protein
MNILKIINKVLNYWNFCASLILDTILHLSNKLINPLKTMYSPFF